MNMQGQPREWTYEELCDSCREMVAEMDTRRWLIGDTAKEIKTRYSDKTMESFARDIGQNKSTVYQYCKVSEFYEPIIRRRILDELPNLTYTYLRDAMRLEYIGLALEWLEVVSDNGMTADEASHKLTEKLGHKTQDSYNGLVTKRYKGIDGDYVNVFIEGGSKWQSGQKVVIRAK